MSDFTSLPEEALDRWLAGQHHALVNDLATVLDLKAGLREAMIPARHADLVAGLRDVLDVEAGLSAIVSAAPDDPFDADPEPWRVEELSSSSGSVAVAVRRGASARVFISHASEDHALAEELERQLIADGHEVVLDQYVHDDIAVGEDWKRRLHQRLQWADAMVCVVTSAYLASRLCSVELGVARSQGSWLLPVQAEPGVDDPLLRSVTNTDLAWDSTAAALVRTLRRVDDTGVLGWPKDRSPFPGLEPFTAARTRVFFGRAAEAREVVDRLHGMGSTGGVLAIVGPSGCGKSSLLNAAVVPLLERDSAWLVVPSLVPGSDPLPELARALANTANHLELGWSPSDVRDRLEAGADGLHRVAEDLLAASPGTHQRRLLVSIDQTEELFTRTTPAALQRFMHLLREAVAGPVRVVVAMRSEFLDDLRDLPALAGVPIEAYLLAPLDREALREVIEQPARLARLRLDDGLADQLIADTDSGEALPLLAFTLRQLADDLPAEGTLSLARYRDLGGVRGALARHADVALAEAVRASGLTEREVLAGLTRLVTVDETGRRARRRIKLAGLTAPLRVALGIFVERRLLLSDTDDIGQVWLTVAHEALLTGWRPLEVATADVIAALRTAREVEQAAAEWASANRPDHYLWDDKRLTATLATLGMAGDDGHRNPAVPPIVELDDEAWAFLDATTQRVHVAKERERRRRTCTITVLSALLVLALSASVFAFQQRNTAQRERDTAIFNQITAQADRLRSTDTSLAAQLDLTAYRTRPTPDLYTALITLGNAVLSTPLVGHTDGVKAVAFSPNGHILATGSADRSVRLWNVSDPAHPSAVATLTGHTNVVDAVAFSPNGHTLATGSRDQTVRLWNVTDPTHPISLGPPLTGHTDYVYSVAFSPDGHLLVTGSADQTVRLWNVSDPTHPSAVATLTGHTNVVDAVTFSPDGRTLATGSRDQTVRLWNVTDPTHPISLGPPLTGHTDSVTAVAFSPDGRTLATGSADQTVRLWNVTDPTQPTALGPPLTGHTDYVYAVVFSPDGRTLATASGDQTVRLWNVSDPTHPTLLGPPLTGHTDSVTAVAFSRDGRILATGSADRTARLWNIPQTFLNGHTSSVNAMAFSPNGYTLATASSDRTVRLWNLSDPAHPTLLGPPLTGHTDYVSSVAFSPDGRILATGSDDTTVRLWNVTDPAHPTPLGQPLTGHTSSVSSVAFSPDGHTLTTASADRTVRLWNVSDPAHPTPLGRPLTGHTDSVTAVAFSPDGRTLATGSRDHTVRLWNVTDPAHPTPLGLPLTGHTSAVVSVAFSPDGHTLATGSYDHTIRLWNLTDLTHPIPLGSLTGHTSGVNSVAFSPDGHTLATGSDDHTTRLWRMNVDRAIQRICTTTTNTLTPATWKQYVSPDLPYHPPCP